MSAITITRATWHTNEQTIKSIRMPVFVEEQNVPFDIDFDHNDASAIHWLARNEQGRAIGTARMLSDGHFGRMAVLKESRNQGIGRQIMQAALEYAIHAGMEKVYLNAQLHARAFYERLGFSPYGDVFLEANIEHIGMARRP